MDKQNRGDLNGAIADYTAALTANPGFAEAYFNRGNAKLDQGDIDGAAVDFDAALRIDRKMIDAYVSRGVAKRRKGDSRGAVADYDQALRLEPRQPGYIYENRGYAKSDYGDIAGAIGDFGRCLEHEPTRAEVYSSRGYLRAILGDQKGGLADVSRALELDSKCASAFILRGGIRYQMQDWAGALPDFRRYCELEPSNTAYPRFFIWLLRVRQGEGSAARKELAIGGEQKVRKGAGTAEWVERVRAFLLDEANEPDFLRASKSNDPERNRDQQCEAWYYAGMKRLLAGDRAMATKYFQECIGTGAAMEMEFAFAQTELKSLH